MKEINAGFIFMQKEMGKQAGDEHPKSRFLTLLGMTKHPPPSCGGQAERGRYKGLGRDHRGGFV
jgi:hypothetical protein